MTVQNPSTIVASDIDLGNAIVYYSPVHFNQTSTAFSTAVSSTKWRKLGILKEGAQLELTKEAVEFFSGVPSRLQQKYYTAENLKLSGQLLEWSPRALARCLGGLTLTETVKSSSPAATTVATGSTKSVINFASASGYAVDDEIRVGNSGSYQYGRIQSIATNAVTLYEALDGDTNPTTGHAIAKIDTTSMDLGSVAAPANIGLKISKTLIGGYGSYDLYIIKAQMDANLTVNWADNGNNLEGIGLPFSAQAISDPAVESGNIARWLFTQT